MAFKKYKIQPALLIIPFFILGWGFFCLSFFDVFYSRNTDPEYPYLINGLNIALLQFNRIGHFDHPGTPFQVFCGIIIRLTHLFTGKGAIAQDVFNRSSYYLYAINIALIIIQSALVFTIGWIASKRGIKAWQTFLLQAGVLLNPLLLWVFSRVIPEQWLIITSLLFIIVYLLYGYENRNPLKFAVWSGIVMGMGIATKFNFLPILLLPLLLISNNKNRLKYILSGIISFIICILPINIKIGAYLRFITSIARHDGIYGQGQERMFNFEMVQHNIKCIFEAAPELTFILALVILAFLFSIFYKQTPEKKRNRLLFGGIFIIFSIQMLMVSKHFKDAYLIPVFSIYGFLLFIFDKFIRQIFGSKKWNTVPIIALFVVFVCFSAKQVIADVEPIKQHIEQREEIRQYVSENLPQHTLWFVEPTWESAPYVENGIVYGLSYCWYKENYLPELIRKNPYIITYEGQNVPTKIWREFNYSLESVVIKKTPLYIYSTPGRNANILMELVNTAAEKQNVTMIVDTVFSQMATQAFIIRMQNPVAEKDLHIGLHNIPSKEEKIQNYIQTIKNDPDWLKKIEQKSKERNISLDSMIYLDAVWMAERP